MILHSTAVKLSGCAEQKLINLFCLCNPSVDRHRFAVLNSSVTQVMQGCRSHYENSTDLAAAKCLLSRVPPATDINCCIERCSACDTFTPSFSLERRRTETEKTSLYNQNKQQKSFGNIKQTQKIFKAVKKKKFLEQNKNGLTEQAKLGTNLNSWHPGVRPAVHQASLDKPGELALGQHSVDEAESAVVPDVH